MFQGAIISFTVRIPTTSQLDNAKLDELAPVASAKEKPYRQM